MANPKNLFGVLDIQDAVSSRSPESPPDSHSDDEALEGLARVTQNSKIGEAASTAAEMPPNGRQRPPPKREADFTSLLTIPEKNEAVSLMGRLTDLMQKHITLLFDIFPNDDSSAPPMRQSSWNKLPTHLRDLTLNKPAVPAQKENLKPLRPKKAGRARERLEEPTPSTAEVQLLPLEQPKLGPRQQELKKDSLQHFKRWQTAVQKRVGDISIKKAPDGFAAGGKRGSAPHKKRRSTSKSRKTPDSAGH